MGEKKPYSVTAAIEHDRKFYPIGGTIRLTDSEATELASSIKPADGHPGMGASDAEELDALRAQISDLQQRLAASQTECDRLVGEAERSAAVVAELEAKVTERDALIEELKLKEGGADAAKSTAKEKK
ncbi:hypothetical protein GURASL_13580 [Geotalea uraniireducens]|uniref:Uncharacterized protein n=1 Tax=Geotalea uraniireducens TaxID=351604 RepID=A0ABM8EKB3_9BACT|nr:hypothetical protein [Geotalea uraniireducens]BDV42435.1 hypothetical protein GURASL_13580 [Geotalea uraniireducens]